MHHICFRHGFSSLFLTRDEPSRAKPPPPSPIRPRGAATGVATSARSPPEPENKPTSSAALLSLRPAGEPATLAASAPTRTTGLAPRLVCASSPDTAAYSLKHPQSANRANRVHRELDRTSTTPGHAESSNQRLSPSSPRSPIPILPPQSISSPTSYSRPILPDGFQKPNRELC